MKAYKGFEKREDGTLWCHGFQYEVGKTYKFEGEPVLCKQGFHACHEPYQCWVFYPNDGENVYYEVECGGTIIESNNGDGKFVCTEITLVKEIPAPETKFDCCGDFQDGYAKVKLDGKYNHINTEGKLLSELWFDCCGDFHNGYAEVRLNSKYNFIDTEGKYLSEQWFDNCGVFNYGYAKVWLNGKWNYINTKGKYLSEQWFDDCCDFQDGCAWVKLGGKWYRIDKNGKIIQLCQTKKKQRKLLVGVSVNGPLTCPLTN